MLIFKILPITLSKHLINVNKRQYLLMTSEEQQMLTEIGWMVNQNSRLMNLAILAKSVMQVNLKKNFTSHEWNLIMQDVVCDTAMQKVIAEAQRYLRESNTATICLLISPSNYQNLAKYIIGIASATILKEYRSRTIVSDDELLIIMKNLNI